MDNRQTTGQYSYIIRLPECINIHTNRKGSRPVILSEIQELITEIDNMGIPLHLEWIPSHIDIKGNEIADELAKNALNKDTIDLNILPGEKEIISKITKKANEVWQTQWTNTTNNWLRSINPVIPNKIQIY